MSNLITALEGAAVNAAAGAANNNNNNGNNNNRGNNNAAAGANAAAAAAETGAGAGAEAGAGQGAPAVVDTNNGVAAPTPVIEGAATNAAADPALTEQVSLPTQLLWSQHILSYEETS